MRDKKSLFLRYDEYLILLCSIIQLYLIVRTNLNAIETFYRACAGSITSRTKHHTFFIFKNLVQMRKI